jgi:acyl carrier protein
VRDAAVVAQQSRFGRRLVGFAVLGEAVSASPISLRRSLAALLPDYALPSTVILLEELPLNRNGKVDRPGLESHTGRDRPAGLSSAHRPPSTETEHAVTDTWELLMDVAGIGIDDDFFELGGHSLLAVAITSELTGAAGVRVRPGQLYEHSTIAELAGLLDRLRTDQAGTAVRSATSIGSAS